MAVTLECIRVHITDGTQVQDYLKIIIEEIRIVPDVFLHYLRFYDIVYLIRALDSTVTNKHQHRWFIGIHFDPEGVAVANFASLVDEVPQILGQPGPCDF